MKVDITFAGSVVQDFTNKKIEVLNKEGFPIWQNSYKSADSFNRTFRTISKQFVQEVSRREIENYGKNSKKNRYFLRL